MESRRMDLVGVPSHLISTLVSPLETQPRHRPVSFSRISANFRPLDKQIRGHCILEDAERPT